MKTMSDYITKSFLIIFSLTGYYDSPTCIGSKKFNDSIDNKLAASDRENINANIRESLQM